MKIAVGLYWIFLLTLMASCNNETTGKNSSYSALKTGFVNPPIVARPKVYWWWLNGHVDTTRLKRELTDIRNAGLGGVDIFEIGIPESENSALIPAGPSFMGDEFLKTIKAVVSKARELDLEVGFNLASSWNAGGSWTLPEHASKTLYVSRIAPKQNASGIFIPFPVIPETDPRGRKRVILYGADKKPVYREEVAVLAIPKSTGPMDTSRVINVSQFFDAERDILHWQVPAGDWELQRYVCANSGEQLFMPSNNSVGPIIDHFDSAATRTHIEYFVKKLKPVVGDFANSPIKYFYLASYEAKDFAWTSSLPLMFKKTNGYDLYKYLPALFDKQLLDEETGKRFQFDYRKTLSELMINNHYRKAKEVTNQYGLKIASEAGGPGVYTIPVETIKALGSLDIPRGEFWHKTTRFDKDSVDIIWLVKEIAAASHIYKRDFVEEEAFTSFSNDWQEGPADLKPLADRAFCEGMNRVVIHGMTHNPNAEGFPGIGYFAGTHFNPKSLWWNNSKPFVDYLSRISFMLQQGQYVSDVLYYYGDDVPNLVPPKNTLFKVGDGYDYEIINTEILLNDLVVNNDKLELPGVGSYHVLCIGNGTSINPVVLEKLNALVQKGAIIIGGKPSTTPGLYNRVKADESITTSVNKVWTSSATNQFNQKGKVYTDAMPLAALNFLKVIPDFSYTGQNDKKLDFIHFRKDDLDFYLIRNTSNQWVSKECLFRQKAKLPELWNPETGAINHVLVYKQLDGQISMPLSFPPKGAFIITFKEGKEEAHLESISVAGVDPPLFEFDNDNLYFLNSGSLSISDGSTKNIIESKPVSYELTGSWNVSFTKKWGAPDSAVFSKLKSWTNSDDAGIRYFSGTGTYTKTFEFAEEVEKNKILLQLGNVSKVAEVWLNGQSLGTAWTQPYQFDISSFVKRGTNNLTIAVSNNWSNRLIGDAVTGEQFTSSNIKFSNRSKKVLWKDTPLIESGLLGPVTIKILKPVSKNI